MCIYSIIIKYNVEFSSLCYIAGPCWLSFFKFLFIYLFLAVLGLHCCVRAFSSCGEQGLLFTVMDGLLIAVASLVVAHGFSCPVACGFLPDQESNSCPLHWQADS